MAAHIADCAAPGGRIIASGIIEKHRQGAIESLKATGATIEETIVDGDWIALIASV